jgi:hypothetical protein
MNKSYWKAMELMRDGMFVEPELIREVLDRIPADKKQRICVLFSFEMLPMLQSRGYTDVTLVTNKPKKYIKNICAKYGYKVVQLDGVMNMEFDVVLSNPPYQSANQGERNIGAPEWPNFISLGMNSLVEGGVGVFITPATWMNRSKQGAWKSIRDYDLTFVNPNVKEHFPNVGGNGGTFCYFVMKKQKYSGSTEISGGQQINFHEDVIPKNNKYVNEEGFRIIKSLLGKTVDTNVLSGPIKPSINSDHWSDVKTDTHLYETYYSGASDRRSIWCDEPVGDHGKWKLVVASSGSIYKTMEITKKGVGRQGNYILGESKEQLEQVLELLLSDDSRTLCEVMLEGNYNNALEYVVK